MCEYCKSKHANKKIRNDKYGTFQISGNMIDYQDEDGTMTSCKIKYCTMCGRELKKESER